MKRLWAKSTRFWVERKQLKAVSKKWIQKLSRWARGSLGLMTVGSLILGLGVPFVVLYFLDNPDVLALFGLDGTVAVEGRPAVRGINPWQEVLIAAGVVTLSAAIIGLVISYRRQRDAEDTKRKTEFANAAAQLGSDSASVRIAGVYAMATVAEGSPTLRQQCIDVLCGHLRLPYTPGVDNSSERTKAATRHMSSTTETDTYTFQQVPGEREVRFTIIRVISDHLRHNRTTSWRGHDFDFTGAVFDGGDFSGAHFTEGNVSFRQTHFIEEYIDFAGARFSGGKIDFTEATFSEGSVSFHESIFSGGEVRFGAIFSGFVNFDHAVFSGSRVDFGNATFTEEGSVSFTESTFSKGEVHFIGAEFTGGDVSFSDTTFSGSFVNFAGTKFSGGYVRFDATFSSGDVILSGITGELSSGQSFEIVTEFLPGGEVDFAHSSFTGANVRMAGADFSGGTVWMKTVRDWTVPPTLPSPAPKGLHLPDRLRA